MTSGLAKVILVGEHAVVYGHPALAGAIDRRVRCRAAGSAPELSLRCRQWQLDVKASDDHPVARALGNITSELGIAPQIMLEVDAAVPVACGLGSSAALSVAVTRCLAESHRRVITSDELEHIANAGERAFHANPSGVDVALAVRGGIGTYSKSTGFTPLRAREIHMAIGLSGEPRSTAAMVEKVATQMHEREAETAALLTSMGEAATAAATSLEHGVEIDKLGALFDTAHESLRALGLATRRIDELVRLARENGAAGTKLTGAGGGGAVIAIAEDPERIARAWRAAGFEAFTVNVGARP